MIELCAQGEKTLERFRYQFPDDWLYSDQLKGEWSAYNEILKRKNDSIQEQLGQCGSNAMPNRAFYVLSPIGFVDTSLLGPQLASSSRLSLKIRLSKTR